MATTFVRPNEPSSSPFQSGVDSNNNIIKDNSINKISEKEGESSFKIGCCHQLQAEVWAMDVTMFGTQDSNGEMIDLHQSFCTGRHQCHWAWLMSKFVFWALTVGTFIFIFYDYPYGNWFLAYVSYWTLMYSCVYMTLSLILAVWKAHPPLLLIRVTWVLYSVVAVHGWLVVLLYWTTGWGRDSTFQYRSIIGYRTLMVHGGIFALCVVDGLWINKIPVRLCHFVFVLALAALFVVWTLVQAFLPVENRKPGGDNLYDILNWTKSPGEAAVVSVLVLFVDMTLCMIMFWGLSLSNRRYVMDAKDKEEACESSGDGTAEDLEMDRMEATPIE